MWGSCRLLPLTKAIIVVCSCCRLKPGSLSVVAAKGSIARSLLSPSEDRSLLIFVGEIGSAGIIVCCHCWVKTDSWVSLSVVDVGISRAQRIIFCFHRRGKLGSWDSLCVAAARRSWDYGDHCLLAPSSFIAAAALLYDAYNIPSII